MADIDKVVIHCSDSPRGRGDTAETIHRWHKQNDWAGIGYHYVILEDGTVERGRPEYWSGAHVRGHNKGSIGICLIGQGSYTEDQFGALVHLLRDLQSRYPGCWIVGHYQLDNNKDCPMFDVPAWLDERGFH